MFEKHVLAKPAPIGRFKRTLKGLNNKRSQSVPIQEVALGLNPRLLMGFLFISPGFKPGVKEICSTP